MATLHQASTDPLLEAGPDASDLLSGRELLLDLLDSPEFRRRQIAASPRPVPLNHPLLRRSPGRLRPRSVLYYPSCGHDWAPLLRPEFQGNPKGPPAIDTFVYCDHYMDQETILAHLISEQKPLRRGGLWIESFSAIPPEQVASLNRVEDSPVALPIGSGSHRPVPWGWHVRLMRHVGEKSRFIELLYLSAEGVATYWNLFARYRRAPTVLCRKRPATHAYHWTGPVGLLQQTSGSTAPFLITTDSSREEGAPWTAPWGEFHDWDSVNESGGYKDQVWGFRLPEVPPARGAVHAKAT
ncbi:MAG: hypothetical protein KF833_03295 [Verrucomicrobiae bacterium]|nr:hypothetical protein [Verrucomicrobiae bacterium]